MASNPEPKYKVGDKVCFKTRTGHFNSYLVKQVNATTYRLKCFHCGNGDKPEYDADYPISTTDKYAKKITKLHRALS